MAATPSFLACCFPSNTGRGAAYFGPAISSVLRSAGLLAAFSCWATCTALPPARMLLPVGLAAAAPFSIEVPGAGRFMLDGQTVTFQGTGDALSVFDKLRLDRVSAEFETPDANGHCDGSATALTVGVLNIPARRLGLSCHDSGRLAGELQLTESRLASARTRQVREVQAFYGALLIGICSEHALAGSPLPLSQPAGYRLMIQGREIASLDLAGGTAVLRCAESPEPHVLDAAKQAALAIGPLFDPAVTLG